MFAGRTKHYFVADIHLGLKMQDEHEREAAFAGWLDAVAPDAAALYLLGDIFDFWWEYKYVVPKGYVRILGRLAQLVDAGVAVHFFKGNHDRWTFGYLEQEIGIKVYDKPRLVQIGETCFCLGHGDGGTRLWEKMFASPFLQRCFSTIHPRWGMGLGYGWSARNRIKHNASGILPEDVSALYRFAELFPHRVDYFVFGHFHTPVDVQIAHQGRFIVLGEWMPDRRYAVFDEKDKTFEVKSVTLQLNST